MSTLKFSIKSILPFAFGYIFVGIAFGILMRQAGYSPFWVFVSSLFIYAGSMQIVMLTLLSSGVNLAMLAIMAFFINARHIFYGIGFVESFKKLRTEKWGFIKYPYVALTMTDETYSVLCTLQCPQNLDKNKVTLCIQFVSHMLWVACSTSAAFLGDIIPFNMDGIAFSATAFFVVVVINQWRSFPSKLPAIIGFCSAIVFYFVLGKNNFILPALSVSVVALIILKERIAYKFGGGEI